MSNLRTASCLAAVALVCAPLRAWSQAPAMTPAESEAYEMSLQMTFVCSPDRHRSMPESSSMIERATGSLPGTAALLRTAEGTFLVLEGYNESQAGHCLVLTWFGGELAPGQYAIRRLSMAAMEEEQGSGEHSFYTFSAIRAPEESATLVTESGSLEITAMDGDAVKGSFELTGFTVNSQTRVDDVALQGTFTALEGQP